MKKCLSVIGMVALALIFGIAAAFAAETRGLSVIVKDPATGQPAGEVKLYGKAYAVLIGIDKYSDPEIPRLKNAVSDARGIKKVLEQQARDAKGPPPVLSWDPSTRFINEAVQMVVLKNADAATVLKKATAEMQKELDASKRK